MTVLAALAGALQLDDDATGYLFDLGRQSKHATPARLAAAESVSPWLHDLLGRWTTTAAFVHGRRLDVLAANALTPVAKLGTNKLYSFFLDGESRARYYDLEAVFTDAVAYFGTKLRSALDVKNLVD